MAEEAKKETAKPPAEAKKAAKKEEKPPAPKKGKAVIPKELEEKLDKIDEI